MAEGMRERRVARLRLGCLLLASLSWGSLVMVGCRDERPKSAAEPTPPAAVEAAEAPQAEEVAPAVPEPPPLLVTAGGVPVLVEVVEGPTGEVAARLNGALRGRHVRQGVVGRTAVGEAWLALNKSAPLMSIPVPESDGPCGELGPGEAWVFPTEVPTVLLLGEAPSLWHFDAEQGCFRSALALSTPAGASLLRLNLAAGRHQWVWVGDLMPEVAGKEVLTLRGDGFTLHGGLGESVPAALKVDAGFGASQVRGAGEPVRDAERAEGDDPYAGLSLLMAFNLADGLEARPAAAESEVQPEQRAALEVLAHPEGLVFRGEFAVVSSAGEESRTVHLLYASADASLREVFRSESTQTNSGEEREVETRGEHLYGLPFGVLLREYEETQGLGESEEPAYGRDLLWRDRRCNVKGKTKVRTQESRRESQWFYSPEEGSPLLLSRVSSGGVAQPFRHDQVLERPEPADLARVQRTFAAELVPGLDGQEQVSLYWDRVVVSDSAGAVLATLTFSPCDALLKVSLEMGLSLQVAVTPSEPDRLRIDARREVTTQTLGLEAEACVERQIWQWGRFSGLQELQRSLQQRRTIGEACDDLF